MIGKKMKLLIIGLVLCNLLGLVIAYAWMIPYPWSILIIILTLGIGIFVFEQLRKHAKKKWGIKTVSFILLSEFPGIIISPLMIMLFAYMDNNGYKIEFLEGLMAFLWSVSWLLVSGILIMSTVIGTGIRCFKKFTC